MTLEEIRAAKKALESETMGFLSSRFAEFALNTGCPVESISVTMYSYQCMGESIGGSRVGEVDLRINTGL